MYCINPIGHKASRVFPLQLIIYIILHMTSTVLYFHRYVCRSMSPNVTNEYPIEFAQYKRLCGIFTTFISNKIPKKNAFLQLKVFLFVSDLK